MMTIPELAQKVCQLEKGKEEVNIAQMMEILKIIAGLRLAGSLETLTKYADLMELLEDGTT